MPPALTLGSWLTLHGMVTVAAVLVYVISSHVMQQRRHPTAAIAWILFILLLPYLALPAYLAFGSRKLARPRSTLPSAVATPGSGDDWAVETLRALGQPEPAGYRALVVHGDGAIARDALFETIAGARTTLDVCTFILAPDALGNSVIDALGRRARDGVRVRLLLDGMGRLMAGRPDVAPLTRAGGQVCWFVPPLHSPLKGRTNLRNHRKLVVADAGDAAARLWCGGRNLAIDYFDGSAARPAWRDLTFDLQGPLVQQAAQLFAHDWAFARGERRPLAPMFRETDITQACDGQAQLVASGPDQADDTLHALFVTAAYRARERILLATPYFVPDAALLMALCLAARRGVQVDLLLPARSNHRLSDLGRCRALRSLAAAGAHLWLVPGMLHAKLVVVDDGLALAGSANLDSRSLFLNYELMMAFHAASDVRRFTQWFDAERASARRSTIEPAGLLRDVAEGMVLWLGFQL
jgi:cardiolipin synthase